jgi:hypothetical protein
MNINWGEAEFSRALNSSFVEHNSHPSSETKPVAEHRVEQKVVRDQRFP